MLATLLFVATARAQSPELRFERAPPLVRCPDEAAFRAMLRERGVEFALGPEDPRSAAPDITHVEVSYRRGRRARRVRVEVRARAGETEAPPWAREFREASCGALPPELATHLSFLLRSVDVGAPPQAPPGAPPLSPPRDPEAARVVRDAPRTEPTPRAPPAPPPPPRDPPLASRRARLHWGVHLGGGVTALSYPEVEPDLLLGASLGGDRWQLRAQLLVGVRRALQREATTWSLQRWMGDLAACYMLGVFGVCGGVQAGSVQVAVQDATGTRDAESVDVSAIARALIDVKLRGVLRFWATLDGVVQLVAHRVEANDGATRQALWSSGGLGLSAAAGLGLRFW